MLKDYKILRKSKILLSSLIFALTSCGDRGQYDLSRQKLAKVIAGEIAEKAIENFADFKLKDKIINYSGYWDRDRVPTMTIYDGLLTYTDGTTVDVNVGFKVDEFTCFYLSEDKNMSNELFVIDDLPELTEIIMNEQTTLKNIYDETNKTYIYQAGKTNTEETTHQVAQFVQERIL